MSRNCMCGIGSTYIYICNHSIPRALYLVCYCLVSSNALYGIATKYTYICNASIPRALYRVSSTCMNSVGTEYIYTFAPTPDPLTSHHEILIHLSCRAKKKAFAWSGSSIPRACYPGSAVCISISSIQHDGITAYRRRCLLTGGHICLRIHIQAPRFPEAFILYLEAVC